MKLAICYNCKKEIKPLEDMVAIFIENNKGEVIKVNWKHVKCEINKETKNENN